jgi:hypothetical protein
MSARHISPPGGRVVVQKAYGGLTMLNIGRGPKML